MIQSKKTYKTYKTNTNVKRDCFAYKDNEKGGECTALRELYCANDPNCAFYKPSKCVSCVYHKKYLELINRNK